MHGNHEKDRRATAALFLAHALAVAGVAWLLLGGGLAVLDGRLPLDLSAGEMLRRWTIVGLSTVYLLRFSLTGFVFLPRRMDWTEAAVVGLWVGLIHLTFALGGGTNSSPMGPASWVGSGLYLFGSFLNTASEWQRQHFKNRPENKGRLFVHGFYRWCRHPNYLGDVILFTGFALVAGRAWTLWVPAVMTLSFIYGHIPTLDRYLAERYGEDFQDYAGRTRRLFPGIW